VKTSAILLVPVQHRVPFYEGYPATSDICQAFDGDTKTYASLADDGSFELWYADEVAPLYLLMNLSALVSGVLVSLQYDDGGYEYHEIVTLYAENGDEDNWDIHTAVDIDYIRRLNTNAADAVVMALVDEQATTKHKLSRAGTPPYTTDVFNIVLAAGFDVPLPDEGVKQDVAYNKEPFPGRTPTGNYFPHFRAASTLERIERKSYRWSMLTTAQKENFELFVKSFGTGGFSPCWLAILTDDESTAGVVVTEFHPLLFDGEELVFTHHKDGYWDVEANFTILQR